LDQEEDTGPVFRAFQRVQDLALDVEQTRDLLIDKLKGLGQ
jgi:hypothetical protein